jgi:hypothetical protein
MATLVVKCPKCQAPLDSGILNTGELQPCGGCLALVQAEVFPALFRRAARGVEGEQVLLEDEASCFYHPLKKAVRPCDGCGRFLCALCDCELNGQHYCPSCLEAGRKKGKIKNLENHRTNYDSLALTLVLGPLVLSLTIVFYSAFLLTIFTAPAAIFIAIRHWNSPRSIVHRTKIRFVLAIILGVLELIGWVAIIIGIVYANNHGVFSNTASVTVTPTR